MTDNIYKSKIELSGENLLITVTYGWELKTENIKNLDFTKLKSSQDLEGVINQITQLIGKQVSDTSSFIVRLGDDSLIDSLEKIYSRAPYAAERLVQDLQNVLYLSQGNAQREKLIGYAILSLKNVIGCKGGENEWEKNPLELLAQ